MGKAGDGTTYAPETKYPAEGAPVVKDGGNDAIHDGRVTDGPTTSPAATQANVKAAQGK